MTTQVLERIKSAEAEVEAILKRARDNRDATIQKARQDALRHIRSTEESARQQYQQKIQEATEDARRLSERLERQADGEVAAMEESFEGRLQDSKKRILALFKRTLDVQD